ncbi:protein kinase domain-containing protein [Mariniblastus fucicola]|uniref:Serine/threonine-protein kinase PknD n=1 Tax=Mariniblastus fucicola TaxID=980251 RepID=A0A5B9PJQ5_9BACT|nr:protein kinase [Mariniblastus fucicola]QEG24906.1 Serine/threonine-protein kinase PknD [Mariniblastus fucicola]
MDGKNRQHRINELVIEARKISANSLDAFLQQHCADDAELRAAVEKELGIDPEHQLSEFESTADGIRDSALSPEQPIHELSASAADRNLLFGIVALQMNFIDRDSLIVAMNSWALKKTEPIEEILVEQGAMDAAAKVLLSALVDKHLEHHGHSAEESLGALSSGSDDLRASLLEIKDAELGQSVIHLGSNIQDSQSDERTAALGARSTKSGRFRILRPHKNGGLGAVSVALDEELNREVALKEVLPKYSDYQMAHDRLRVEAEITGGLEHPGIVPVYGLGSHPNGSPFYCMRFIQGDSLKGAIRRYHESKDTMTTSDRNLELRSLLRRFIDVCDAVSYAHSRRVLHRDLKPGNIMLGKYGETLVVDWGLAKATGKREEASDRTEMPIVPRSGSTAAPTIAGSAIGTPEYMSPEQAEGRVDQLGPTTDVYSLGATMFCLLTGRPPIVADGITEKLDKVKHGDFPKPTDLDKSIPRPLEAICLKAMRTYPSRRYSTASDLSDDVERWLADETVSAFPEPLLQRATRAIRKNRTAATAVAAATVMALLGLLGMNLVTRSKNREIQARNTEIELRNEQLAGLNNDLTKSNEALNESYKTFRSVTAEMIQKAESELSQMPGMEETRKWLTRTTAETFEEFIDNEPDSLNVTNSENSQIWLAQLLRIDANNLRNDNQIEAAVEKHRNAVSIFEGVVEKNPEGAQGIGMLSESYRDYAVTLARHGQLERSEEVFEETIRLSQQLLSKYPDSKNCQLLMAINYLDFSGLKEKLGDFEGAKSMATKSADLFTALLGKNDLKLKNRRMGALALGKIASFQRKSGDFELARTSVEEAARIARANAAESDMRADQHVLAKVLLESVRIDLDRTTVNEETVALIKEAIGFWEQLHEQYREFSAYHHYLVASHTTYGQTLSQNDEIERATVQFENAIRLGDAFYKRNPKSTRGLERIGDALLVYSKHELKNGNREESLDLARRALVRFQEAVLIQPKSALLKEQLAEARELVETAEKTN